MEPYFSYRTLSCQWLHEMVLQQHFGWSPGEYLEYLIIFVILISTSNLSWQRGGLSFVTRSIKTVRYLEVNFNVNFKNRTKGKKESTFIYLNLVNYVFANRFGTNDTRRLVHLWRKHWDDLHTGISADILYVSSARTGIIAY